MTTERVFRPGAYEGFSERRYEGWERSSVYVTMRDGVQLAMEIIRPSAGGAVHTDPLPVLVAQTPYTRAFIAEDGSVGPPLIDGWDRMLRLVGHGYVVAVARQEPKGDLSQHRYRFMTPNPRLYFLSAKMVETFAQMARTDAVVAMGQAMQTAIEGT